MAQHHGSTHGHGADDQHNGVQQVVDTHHVIEPIVYYKVFGVLTILFILTVVAALFDVSKMMNWPPANIIIALIIAVIKAAVVVLYFMHVKYASRLTQMFAGAALLWLVVMFAFTFADYFSRSWIPQPGSWTVPVSNR